METENKGGMPEDVFQENTGALQAEKKTDDWQEETIAAIATAASPSGIGIIRISGKEAVRIGDQVFHPARKGVSLAVSKGYTVHYGHLYDGDRLIDEGIVLLMRAPHSYTAEDTVEIQCHGGILVMRRILEAVFRAGARPAEPGEFTKRAFLNGRLDLSQAEAVMDVIRSENEYALKSSLEQLGGSLSSRIRNMRETLLYEIARIESALDDPEHHPLDGYAQKLDCILDPIVAELDRLISSSDEGRILMEGIRTVILGKPNAGKSSLMNVLLGEDRAIVTEIAGTTRDTLEENLRLRGLSLRLVDTAGIRDTEDRVEQMGVERARKIADSADLILFVADGSRPLDENDRNIIRQVKDKRSIVLLNKTDLETVLTQEELARETGQEVIAISAREETGIEKLEQRIEELFLGGDLTMNGEVMITNARHKKALEEARESLLQVKQSIRDGMPEDFYSIDLTDAYAHLGAILGEALEDDVVEEIFSRFCTGK